MRSNIKIGELLLQKQLITKDQLDKALVDQLKSKEALGKICLRLGFVKDETKMMQVIAEQLNIPLIGFDELKPKLDQQLKNLIPADLAKSQLILPLKKEANTLTVAFCNGFDLIFLDNLKKMTHCQLSLVLATESDITAAIEAFYEKSEFEEVVKSTETEESPLVAFTEELTDSIETLAAAADQPPVIRLVDALLIKAIEDRASDIHIEPFHNRISVRYRVDGILYDLSPPSKELHAAVVSRIKIMAKLDIAEKRIPQDGAFALRYKNKAVDIRLSTVPVIYGEKVVMRILDKGVSLKKISELGFDPDQLKLFEEAIERPTGLIFLTGPTGSGKTTTLYAAIQKIHSPDINIMTIEDPVEYQLEGVNQMQVKSEIGLTFASGLRAFLRQDPDVILVGEVRDLETAEICMRASLTGHLVFSTLHTNDAVTAISRLMDLGIKPYLIASTLIMVGGQRLVRRLCQKCKESFKPSEKMIKDFNLKVKTLYKAKGCKDCRSIGYWGRVAIYETLPIDEQLRSLITREADIGTLRKYQLEKGYKTLFQSGVTKAQEGLTSLEEVTTVAYEEA